MTKSDITSIKAAIDEINLLIDNSILDMDNGLISDLSPLDSLIAALGSQISSLPSSEFVHIKEDLRAIVAKIEELKTFLTEEIESTSNKIKATNTSITAAKKYGNAANDNS